nr:paraneoplastic antigen Ma6E-like [Aegilops tauschii subsp. strangulata]
MAGGSGASGKAIAVGRRWEALVSASAGEAGSAEPGSGAMGIARIQHRGEGVEEGGAALGVGVEVRAQGVVPVPESDHQGGRRRQQGTAKPAAGGDSGEATAGRRQGAAERPLRGRRWARPARGLHAARSGTEREQRWARQERDRRGERGPRARGSAYKHALGAAGGGNGAGNRKGGREEAHGGE